jgi:hypothetical protein
MGEASYFTFQTISARNMIVLKNGYCPRHPQIKLSTSLCSCLFGGTSKCRLCEEDFDNADANEIKKISIMEREVLK